MHSLIRTLYFRAASLAAEATFARRGRPKEGSTTACGQGIRRAAMLAAWSVLLLGVPSSSMATVTNAVFEHASYVAPLGEPFPNPLRVTVTDEFDAPVAGVEGFFAVIPDSTGAA